jgi:hypothetical protein
MLWREVAKSARAITQSAKMSRVKGPLFDASALVEILGGPPPPRALGREGCVVMIGQVAERLMKLGDAESLYVGGALLSWLEQGGSLEHDYFKVTQRGNHRTPQLIWKMHSSAMRAKTRKRR